MFKLTVKRDHDWDEWIATITFNNLFVASYHTDDHEDCKATGNIELKNAMKFYKENGFLPRNTSRNSRKVDQS